MTTLDLAAVGNCAVASLIDGSARHVWFCFPRIDADPVFSALVNGSDPDRGFHDIVLQDAVAWKQRYLPNTAIVETVGTDAAGGAVRVIDFAPRHERFGRSFHPHLLVRTIAPLQGRPRIRVRMRPAFDYGATPRISRRAATTSAIAAVR